MNVEITKAERLQSSIKRTHGACTFATKSMFNMIRVRSRGNVRRERKAKARRRKKTIFGSEQGATKGYSFPPCRRHPRLSHCLRESLLLVAKRSGRKVDYSTARRERIACFLRRKGLSFLLSGPPSISTDKLVIAKRSIIHGEGGGKKAKRKEAYESRKAKSSDPVLVASAPVATARRRHPTRGQSYAPAGG